MNTINSLYKINNDEGISSQITIPAYDSEGNGLTVMLSLSVVPSKTLNISSIGSVAVALESNFQRVIEIMSSLRKKWECLMCFSYKIECNDNYKVKDSRSSSLALSIALLNIYSEINGQHQVMELTGAGLLRADGTFEETCFEQKKYYAVKNNENYKEEFITSSRCKHLFELENLINQVKKYRR